MDRMEIDSAKVLGNALKTYVNTVKRLKMYEVLNQWNANIQRIEEITPLIISSVENNKRSANEIWKKKKCLNITTISTVAIATLATVFSMPFLFVVLKREEADERFQVICPITMTFLSIAVLSQIAFFVTLGVKNMNKKEKMSTNLLIQHILVLGKMIEDSTTPTGSPVLSDELSSDSSGDVENELFSGLRGGPLDCEGYDGDGSETEGLSVSGSHNSSMSKAVRHFVD